MRLPWPPPAPAIGVGSVLAALTAGRDDAIVVVAGLAVAVADGVAVAATVGDAGGAGEGMASRPADDAWCRRPSLVLAAVVSCEVFDGAVVGTGVAAGAIGGGGSGGPGVAIDAG